MTRPGSGRRTRGPGAGRDAAHRPQRRTTRVRPGPPSSGRSARPRARAPVSSYPPATQRPWRPRWRRSAQLVAPGAHAVLLLDQAGWHVSTKLKGPDTITLLPLPPCSPELNPVETVWPFVRDNGLSNRIFGSSEEIVDHGCEAWNKLIEQPWIIMSISLRDWAHAF